MKYPLFVLSLVLLAACSGPPPSSIATVDVARISANWPKFINYQNQLSADSAALEREDVPKSEKDRQRAVLQRRYVEMQQEVTDDVRRAAEHVAAERHFKLVVTHESLGYGGTDITPEVEKLLKITESSTARAQ